jgi:hypothetical protein
MPFLKPALAVGVGAVGLSCVLAAVVLERAPVEGQRPPPSVRAEAAPSTPVEAVATPQAAERSPRILDDPALEAALQRIATRAVGQASGPRLEELVKTTPGRDLLVALEHHLRAHPGDSERLIEIMRREADGGVFFVMARALGRTLNDDRARASTLRLLRDVEPKRRADGLVALMGRRERDVVELLVGVLESDPSDDARARAASLLAYVFDDLEPADVERAQWVARATLSRPEEQGRRIVAAAEILGRAGATPEDLDLLKAELLRTNDPDVLGALAYGLGAGGLHPRELRGLLSGRLNEPRLDDVVSKLLAAIP